MGSIDNKEQEDRERFEKATKHQEQEDQHTEEFTIAIEFAEKLKNETTDVEVIIKVQTLIHYACNSFTYLDQLKSLQKEAVELQQSVDNLLKVQASLNDTIDTFKKEAIGHSAMCAAYRIAIHEMATGFAAGHKDVDSMSMGMATRGESARGRR